MNQNVYSNNQFHQSEDLLAILRARKAYLVNVEKRLDRAIGKAPSGSLRINHNKGYVEYYQRGDPDHPNGFYLSKKKLGVAMRLGQKRYDQIVQSSVRNEIDLIEDFLSRYPKVPAEAIASTLPPELRELILPIEEDDESFARRWQSKPYTRKESWSEARRFKTDHGEEVRSKSELIIANELLRAGVPYRYECPVELKNMGTVYPDFTVLNIRLRKELLWEHRGMMDDPTYAGDAIRKMADFAASGYFPGINLIITEETSAFPLDTQLIRAMIQTFCL